MDLLYSIDLTLYEPSVLAYVKLRTLSTLESPTETLAITNIRVRYAAFKAFVHAHEDISTLVEQGITMLDLPSTRKKLPAPKRFEELQGLPEPLRDAGESLYRRLMQEPTLEAVQEMLARYAPLRNEE